MVKERPMSQRPAALGVFVCEQVIIEDGKKNVTPVNCFARRTVQRIPSETVSFVVCSVLSDGNGEVAIDLTIQRLDTLEEIHHRSISVRFRDPLQDVLCVFRIRDFSFPMAGAYQVSLFADKDVIAQRRFRIVKKETS
jgi:hypothetical protein